MAGPTPTSRGADDGEDAEREGGDNAQRRATDAMHAAVERLRAAVTTAADTPFVDAEGMALVVAQGTAVEEQLYDACGDLGASTAATLLRVLRLNTGTSPPPPSRIRLRVWKAASKAGPMQQQDWVLKCLQGVWDHPLAALCGGDALLLSTPPFTRVVCFPLLAGVGSCWQVVVW